jgi:hypothetical protein
MDSIHTFLTYFSKIHYFHMYGKGKIVPVLLAEHHAIKAYWGSGGIAPIILWLLDFVILIDGGWEFSSSTPCPDRLWGPPSLPTTGNQELFPWG